jgi:pyruvate/2-oxoglutarate dehydrogenase complex dihydrolipoamide acyltransferase (E2) component
VKVTVKMPKVADSVDEVAIVELRVASGDTVAAGDPVVEVETDKTTVEVPAPVAGVVREIMVKVDDEVTTGTAVLVIDTKATS